MYVLKAGKVCQKRAESVNEKPAISRLFNVWWKVFTPIEGTRSTFFLYGSTERKGLKAYIRAFSEQFPQLVGRAKCTFLPINACIS